jgi:hypothetical protein
MAVTATVRAFVQYNIQQQVRAWILKTERRKHNTQVTGLSQQTLNRCTLLLLWLLGCIALQIAKSPLSANSAVEYIVSAAGVQQAPSMTGQAAVAVLPHSALNIPVANAPPG